MGKEEYLAGIFVGDGSYYIQNKRQRMVGLTVKDEAFARSFKEALMEVGVNPSARVRVINQGRYFNVRANARHFVPLRPDIALKKAPMDFIRGFYESEGCLRYQRGKYPALSFTNDNLPLLKKIWRTLRELGFKHFNIDSYRNKGYNTMHYKLRNYTRAEIRRFLSLVKPVIKGGLKHR